MSQSVNLNSIRNKYLAPFSVSAAPFSRTVKERICRRICRQLLKPLLLPLQSLLARRYEDVAQHFNDFFFDNLKVDRRSVDVAYSKICRELGFVEHPYESIHRKCFVGLSLSGFKPRNILELGTERGEVTRLLVHLFPEAKIYTVELGSDDPFYKYFHWQGSDVYEADLASQLNFPQINSLRTNTLWLMNKDLPDFDLIWVDGGHEYPEVAWDHFYCIQKLTDGGWIFSDDVIAPDSFHRQCDPNAGDVWDVIRYMNARMKNKFELLLKRERPLDLIRDRKFVAFLQNKKADSGNRSFMDGY